ncbi:hypothetical protein E7T09_02670 [Deinococcus sp. KSM4-11]|uniref:hypothetical protein n=1 Tax=Deinococcus sp. KSM4-11 TaxID=2568654 RepID=UPI0010A50AC0|nr:hypothetical protein [Deinococcus sp. KSM4-11]THF88138.1 hypothetical protein E7T09_02670 [Deinococcus sp. KSM4-11]
MTEDTPTLLRLEAMKPGGAAWWVLLLAGLLILGTTVIQWAVALKEGHLPPSPFELLIALCFVGYGVHQRAVRGGRITVDTATRVVTIEKADAPLGEALTVPFQTFEGMTLRHRGYGWRLVMIHSGGKLIDVTPPDELNTRSLRATAKLIADRVGVTIHDIP